MQRRAFLKGAGVLTIMVAGGQVWRSFADQVPEVGDGAAYEPWRTWLHDAEQEPLPLIHAAILSSNAYNSQPWLFRVMPSRIEMYADIQRNLGAFDPYLREMHFSLGCALENLMLAAAAQGYKASLQLPPAQLALAAGRAKPELVARVGLSRGHPGKNELYDAIPHRHTNREPFDLDKPLPEAFLQDLRAAAKDTTDVKLFLFSDDAERKKIVDIVWDASVKFISDPEVSQSTKPWFRTTPEQVQEFRDGVDLTQPQGKGKPTSYTSLMSSARLFGLIAVRDRYDRPQTIRAGRLWQRAHLLATARGLAARPANGAVEIIDHQRRLQQKPGAALLLAGLTGDATWQPTFMFYMGYPTVPAVASARRSVDQTLMR